MNKSKTVSKNGNCVTQSDNIVDLVLRVEQLYSCIDQEFSQSPNENDPLDDKKVEAWSKEIEKLCEIIDTTLFPQSES